MKLKLLKIEDEARGTKSFFWESEKPVDYLPGQYFYFTLPKLNYPDSRGATRHFTLSSSPTEGTVLRNTTRIRQESGYKKTLAELSTGSVIEGEGPNGTFVFDGKETGPHVFIAGGIGITPFRSMIKSAFDKRLDIPLYLIYSNSDDNFAFGDELTRIDGDSEYIRVKLYDSSREGHLDEGKIKSILEKWKLSIPGSTFWVVGPPAMTDALEEVLAKLKIPSGKIRSEKFTGY